MSGRTLAAVTLGLVLSITLTHTQVSAAQGRAAKPIEIIERGPASSPDASHIDADGGLSNIVDFTVNCNLAVIS